MLLLPSIFFPFPHTFLLRTKIREVGYAAAEGFYALSITTV